MLRVRTIFTGVAGTPYYNNLYFENGVSAPYATLLADVKQFWNQLAAFSATAMQVTVEGTIAIVNANNGEITGTYQQATQTTAGNKAAPYQPPATQGLLRLRTGQYVGGREIKGRVYIPGLAASAGPDRPASTTLAAWNAAGAALVTTSGAGGNQWCVYSPKNGLERSVTTVSAWTEYAVQRSRRD